MKERILKTNNDDGEYLKYRKCTIAVIDSGINIENAILYTKLPHLLYSSLNTSSCLFVFNSAKSLCNSCLFIDFKIFTSIIKYSYPSATSKIIIITNPRATPIVPIFECSPF